MKKFRFFVLNLIILITFCLNSCGEIEPLDPVLINTNPIPGTTSGTFKVDFDGKTFTATTVQALVNDEIISITGLKMPSGELVQITLPAPYNKVGTYTWKSVTAGGGIMALAYNPAGGTGGFLSIDKSTMNTPEFAAYTDTAKIIISKIDAVNSKISGTFEFTGFRYKDPTGGSLTIETKKLTNGSFTDIPFSKDIAVTPTKNTFSAKLNGAAFIPTYINGLNAGGVISIIGRRGIIENIGLSFPNTINIGTYDLDSFGENRGLYIKNSNIDGSGIFGADVGSATITSHDKTNKKVVGTFKFTANSLFVPEKYNITEGAFSIFY